MCPRRQHWSQYEGKDLRGLYSSGVWTSYRHIVCSLLLHRQVKPFLFTLSFPLKELKGNTHVKAWGLPEERQRSSIFIKTSSFF